MLLLFNAPNDIDYAVCTRIGFETQYVVGPWHAFWLRDTDRVTIETFSAELN